jgi:hypothetical protein
VPRETRRLFWPLIAGCALLALAVLAMMPAEKTLGQVIKVVYLHGALSRAGMLGFLAAGVAAALYLVRRDSRLIRWAEGLLWSGWGFWTAHFLVSIPATRLTWGPWIAWGEPRVTMSLQVIAAGLVVIGVTWLIKDARFTAAAIALLALAIALLAARTGVLRHPLDPIGSSPSTTLRMIYLLLLVPVVSSMALVAWRLATRQTELEAA